VAESISILRRAPLWSADGQIGALVGLSHPFTIVDLWPNEADTPSEYEPGNRPNI
jgi:hypothetical protein